MARLEWDASAIRARARKARRNGARGADRQSAGGTETWTVASRPSLGLDTLADPGHWTYKLPGLAASLALVLLVIGLVAFPSGIRAAVHVLAGYLTLRFLVVVLFYPIGMVRIRRAERRAVALSGLPLPKVPEVGAPVHHVVIVPNHKEPVEILERTLDRLAVQDCARDGITVVLAMEESESGSELKGRQLARQYAGQFARVLVTVHPRGLPGEAVGKGSNEAWAARRVKAELVDRLGLPLASITLTSCDADSMFHPRYFAELGRRFVSDPDRYHRFWQAPFRFANNVWHVPASVRQLAILNNMVQVSELANPLAINLPLSTYSLSLQLAHDVDYWDEMVIAEDWHMFLRTLFGSQGQVRLRPIFLPTTGDAVSGGTHAQAFRNAYRQRVRHAWGSSDVGYILQQWGRQPAVPQYRKLLFLAKVVHDHTIFTLAGLILGLGSAAVLVRSGLAGIAQPGPGWYDIFLQATNVMTASGAVAIYLYEHLSSRRQGPGWEPRHLLADIVTWPLLAVATLILVTAPILEAQWRQMLGGALTFSVTSKTLPVVKSPDSRHKE